MPSPSKSWTAPGFDQHCGLGVLSPVRFSGPNFTLPS
jgi:hypothetical protein